jgi:hypothetical protein
MMHCLPRSGHVMRASHLRHLTCSQALKHIQLVCTEIFGMAHSPPPPPGPVDTRIPATTGGGVELPADQHGVCPAMVAMV